MRLRHKTKGPKREIDLLPLINIVMLLLVFFLVVGSIAPKPPGAIEAATTRHAPPVGFDTSTLALDADGLWLVDGAPADDDAVADHLAAWATAGADAEPAAFPVIADRRLAADLLADRLGFLADRGVTRVRLVTEQAR